jgi:hypothetical protein
VPTVNYNATNQDFWFKETYSGPTKNSYNSATAILMRINKRYDLTGVKDHVMVPLGPAGGVGGLVNGYLPEGGSPTGDQMEIISKDVVGRAVIDRKAMKQSASDKGAFIRATKEPVKLCVESYNTLCNILAHGNGDGKFGTTHTTGYVSGTAAAPVIQFDTAFHERWFPKNFQFNFGNAAGTGVEDGLFKVTSVDATNRRVTFARVTGTYDLTSGTNADSRGVYIQNMFGAAPSGFENTIMKTSGNIYTIPYDATSWGAYIYDAASAPPSVQMLNKVMNQQSTRVDQGGLPDFLLTSPEIWSILADMWEPTKRIMLKPRDKDLAEAPGFGIAGLSYTTPEGKDIPIVVDKHCVKDRIYGLCSDAMYMHHLPDHGWWDEDGKVFLRVEGRPWFAATYGGYYENVFNPQFACVWDNLGIS